ncbi:MAG TPA: 4-alpha-glucanotransferase, partial [Afifellaceae bacterium]|nr:4-alpha-glucanotransferase [Afifellaceae bacterium]
MISDQAVRQLAAHAGIMPSYRNLAGIRQSTSRETNMALLRACGIQLDNDAMAVEALKRIEAARSERLLPEELVIVSGKPFRLDFANPAMWQLVLEGSSDPVAEDRAKDFIDLPPMSSGIHKLTVTDGGHSEVIRLIVAPATAPSVADVTGCERLWGINLALYGLHSKRNPGIGDYEDLEQASTALAAHGTGFLGINPVHAIGWNSDEVISPYSPSHRGYLNASHIAVDRIAPVSDRTLALMAAWKENTGGVSQTLVDYESHARHHRPLLRALYDDFAASASPEQAAQFKLFCEREGEALRRFAGFESLSDLHGVDWRTWPVPLQQPNLDDVSGGDNPDFHMWLQWQAENQLQAAQQQARSAGMALGLYLDLAVGARRDGAEAWAEQDSIAEGVSIGAPPDHLSPAGQNWNLAAFAPSKLAANDYRAFRTIVSRNMRRCGLLRIDHVLGLNRCFWIPDDGSPGGYIKHNFGALLAIVRIEAERNRTVVIGEDLGLVPGGFRSALKDSGIYSYSVLQYEKTRLGSFRKPARLPAHSLACFATHDTPTLEGFVKARDIDWWQKLDWIDEREGRKLRRRRKGECAQLGKL